MERLEDVEVNGNGEEDEGLKDKDTDDEGIEHEVEPDVQRDNSLENLFQYFPLPRHLWRDRESRAQLRRKTKAGS